MFLTFTEDQFGLLHASTHIPHECRDVQFLLLEMADEWCVYVDGERLPQMHKSRRDAEIAANRISRSLVRHPIMQSRGYKAAVGLGISFCALVLFAFGLMAILALEDATSETAVIVKEPAVVAASEPTPAALPLATIEPRHFAPEVWDQVSLPLPSATRKVSKQRYRRRPKRRRIYRRKRRSTPSYTWGTDIQIPTRD